MRLHPSTHDILLLQRAALILLVTLAFLGRALAAQQSPSRTNATEVPFGESIDVRVINLEAVVTDGKGRRITGLGPDGRGHDGVQHTGWCQLPGSHR